MTAAPCRGAQRTGRPLPTAAFRRPGTARGDRPRDRDRPYLIVADEPTGDLSTASRAAGEILDLLGQAQPGVRQDDRDGHPRPARRRVALPAGSCISTRDGSSTTSGRKRDTRRSRHEIPDLRLAETLRRSPVRSFLTIASTAVSLFLMMILVSFFQINDDVSNTLGVYNRIVTMSSQGFAGKVPIVRDRQIAAMDGVVAATPFSWFGGKYGEETMPFAQFGVDPQTFFTIYDELTIPRDQLKASPGRPRAGCVIGARWPASRHIKIGGPAPAQGRPLPCRPQAHRARDLRRPRQSRPADVRLQLRLSRTSPSSNRRRTRCAVETPAAWWPSSSPPTRMAALCHKIDEEYHSSDTPTRSMTEEAFGKMFADMLGDLKGVMRLIGFSVVLSLMCVAGSSMAMAALARRTTEVAVLKRARLRHPACPVPDPDRIQ